MTETLDLKKISRLPHFEPDPPSAVRRLRDGLLRLVTLAMGRVLVPMVWIGSRQEPRTLAAQWALRLRYPHESLAGLTTGMTVALRRARTVAFWDHNLLLGVTSGHRTSDEQNLLLVEDRARPSTGAGQARALPVEQSQHVAGMAADLRPREGAQWLETNGFHFNLYRTYANEWWHFEYLPEARGIAPQMLAHPGAR